MRESSRVHISLLLCHALHEEELPLSLAAFLSSKIASISSLNVSPDPHHLRNLLQSNLNKTGVCSTKIQPCTVVAFVPEFYRMEAPGNYAPASWKLCLAFLFRAL
jgi:hypothetical protein